MEVLGVLQDITSDRESLSGEAIIRYPALLAVLAVDVGESSLLWLPLHSVAPAGHQAVHHVQWVVGDAFQHEPEYRLRESDRTVIISLVFKPPVRAVQETGGVTPGIFLLQRLSVSQVQP